MPARKKAPARPAPLPAPAGSGPDCASLAAILDSIDAMVYVADLETCEVVYANRRLQEDMGVAAVGRTCWEVLARDQTGPCSFCTSPRLLDAGGEPAGPVRWEHRNARNGRWYEVVDRAARWTDGRMVRISVSMDITRRKAAEDKLRREEARKAGTLDVLPAPIVVTRRSDGLVLYINRAGREMLELPAGDLAGLHAEAFYVDRADRSAMLDVLRSGAGPACLETRFVTARGREFWGRVSVTALPYGRTPALFAVVQDVTERRQAMDALHESQELFASFMDQIPAGIFIAGRDNRLRYGNRLLRELAGSAGDLLGRLPGEWIPGEFGRAMEEGARQALAGSASSREGRLDGAPGRKLDLLTFPVAREGRPPLAGGIAWDMTELATINALSRRVNAAVGMDDVAEAVVEGMVDALALNLAVLYRVEGGRMVIRGLRAEGIAFPKARDLEHEVGACLCGISAQDATAVFARDIRQDPRCTHTECKFAGIVSYAALPLRLGGELVGVLGLGSVAARDFARHASFLESLAAIAGMGLNKASLYEAVARLAGELDAKVAERTRELEQSRAELETALREIRESQAALRESEGRYRSFFQQAAVGVSLTSQEGRFLRVNRRFAEIMGYAPEELLGMHYEDISHPGDRDADLAQMRRVRGREADTFNLEKRYFRKDGSTVWVDLTLTAVRATGEEPEYYIGVLEDITGRKAAEQALRESEERYRAMFEQAAEGILLRDPEGRVLEANPRALHLLGYGREEFLGTSLRSLIHPEDAAALPMERVTERLLAGELVTLDRRYRRRDGDYIPVQASASLLRERAEPTFLVIFQDVTERRRAEQLLEEAKTAAEAANRAKSEFLAKMSHEIRTPMNAVLGMSENLLATGLDPGQRDMVDSVRRSADSLRTIIDDILDISRIEARRLVLAREDFDLAEALRQAVQPFAAHAADKGLELAVDGRFAAAPCAKGDTVRFRQIVANLVGNAVKFTLRGRVEVEGSSAPLASPDGGGRVEVTLVVRDTGIGIPPDKLEDIFETFTQADAGLARRREGAGLGLAIVRELAGMMDGSVRAWSEPGRGAVFTCVLRLEAGDPAAAAARPAEEPTGRGETRGLRVLLAEDNEENVKVATTFLRRLGHSFAVAGDGQEVLEALAASAFDLVLMDLEMPRMGGLEAASRIRAGEAGEAARKVPILALTAHAVSGFREQCQEAGMDGFLAKPMSFKELAGALRLAAPMGSGFGERARAAAPDPAVLDRDAALASLDHDERLYAELEQIFRRNMPLRLEELQAAFRERGQEAAARAAHSIKGNAATVGAVSLSRLADAAYAHLRQGRWAEAEALLPGLAEGLDQVLRRLGQG